MHNKARDKLFKKYPLQGKKGANVGYQIKKLKIFRNEKQILEKMLKTITTTLF